MKFIEAISVVAGTPLRDAAWFEASPRAREVFAANRFEPPHPLPVFESEAALHDAMREAALSALRSAGYRASELGLMVGCALGAELSTPDALFSVHQAMGASASAPVIVVRSELTNLLDSISIACAESPAWHSERPRLVVIGARMSKLAERFPHRLSLLNGDAAVALTVGSKQGLELLGSETEVLGEHVGAMRIERYFDPVEQSMGDEIVFATDGERVFRELGPTVPVRVARRLLARFDIDSAKVALVGHQVSPMLLQAWIEQLGVEESFSTVDRLGSAGPASVAASLAKAWAACNAEYILAIQLGWGIHFTATLFARRGSRLSHTDIGAAS